MQIHFIAIGGSIMHNLAIALQNKGYTVTGSDDEIYEPAKSRLADNVLLPAKNGWDPNNIHEQLDAVILGMHAKQDNPELQRAQKMGIPIYSFPEYVFEQIKDKQRIVIAGSHGKTTITSMILHVLQSAGRQFNYLVGADIEGFDLMVKLSKEAPVAILEGDEYLTSVLDSSPKFLHYHPQVVLISGIAWDHINVFPTYEEYFHQFERLLTSLQPGSKVIYYQDDSEVRRLVKFARSDLQYLPYRLPDFTPDQEGTILPWHGRSITVPIFGAHNLANLEGAREVCRQLQIDNETFFHAMKTFSGAGKRLELLEKSETCAVYRDFAHAPSKVEAVVKALKDQYPSRTLVACLELHTYSSLQKHFLTHYAGKMNNADVPIVYFNNHALALKRLPQLSEGDIKNGFQNENILVFTNKDELEGYLLSLSWNESNLLMMSSGQFDGLDLPLLAEKVTH